MSTTLPRLFWRWLWRPICRAPSHRLEIRFFFFLFQFREQQDYPRQGSRFGADQSGGSRWNVRCYDWYLQDVRHLRRDPSNGKLLVKYSFYSRTCQCWTMMGVKMRTYSANLIKDFVTIEIFEFPFQNIPIFTLESKSIAQVFNRA